MFVHYPQPPQHNYQFELNRDMDFSAAHYVPNQLAGVCANVHGHTYFVNLTIAGNELDETGFLVNFSTLKKIVHGRYDHTLLNDHKEFDVEFNGNPHKYPTTEVVARRIWYIVQQFLSQKPNKPVCLQVFLRETPTSYVLFRPSAEDFAAFEKEITEQ